MVNDGSETTPLRAWTAVPLNAGFAMTGFATVLLGCLLPSLSLTWHANDAFAGRMLAAQFAGSAAGALLPGAQLRRSVLHGYLLVALVAAALATTGLMATTSFLLQCLLFFVFGLGLGWAMTSTSLLVGKLYRHRRGSALSFLNASWTIGAAACPFVATQWTREYSATALFFPLCVIFASICILLFMSIREASVGQSQKASVIPNEVFRPFAMLALLAFLYVGVETSVSGWMVTFVHRDAIFFSRFWAALAASSFWVAVLCGRLLAPALLLVLSERRLFAGSISLALAGLIILMASHAPPIIVMAAFLCGFSLGPVFPLCISMCLELSGESPRTRYIFAFSGFGGALLPWLTGIASADAHSLRRALGIPLVALFAMVAIALFVVRLEPSKRSLQNPA